MVDIARSRVGRSFGAVVCFSRSCACILVVICVAANAQINSQKSAQDHLRHYYDAAQNAQAAEDLEQATANYKAFLSEALHRMADHRAGVGDFTSGVTFFEEALNLSPNDDSLRLDYAAACSALGDMQKAKSAAEVVASSNPRNPRAHLVLGRTLLALGENDAAKQHLESAVAIDPNFEDGFALAAAHLKLKDPDHAAKIFSEMLAGLGDTAEIHMNFGRAFSEAGYPEQGIQEFKKAIARDANVPGSHYSLGAAYVLGLGEAAFSDAAAEFREELERHPDDVLSLYQLGYIELNQHKLDDAERELTRAAKLDPDNPDLFLLLGQLEAEKGLSREAEAALQKSVVLTKDISRNHFQVQRAHYLLGRLLLQSGCREDAQREFSLSDQLLKQSVAANQGSGMGGGASNRPTLDRTNSSQHSDTLKPAQEYEAQLGLAIADSYNNLGAMAASAGDLWSAIGYFQKTAKWNPVLEGLDYNWGKAAFSAQNYQEAVAPLTRYLRSHSDDTWARAALSSSLLNLGKLNLEAGSLNVAIANLEEGAKVAPESDSIHYELARETEPAPQQSRTSHSSVKQNIEGQCVLS